MERSKTVSQRDRGGSCKFAILFGRVAHAAKSQIQWQWRPATAPRVVEVFDGKPCSTDLLGE